MDDDSTTRLVRLAYNLKELDMYVSAPLSLSLSLSVRTYVFQIMNLVVVFFDGLFCDC
ncbi:hypothetical protein OIU77_000531 [Salix suchowensis]|uniref:Uncharacterized protein n=1 Tax=Salix suchowensis TaxID=1278906 RepID=A0ABQ9B6F1_9ROSI|nr:hypothetical protein OIU77_000531 [Salix suchowensis]